MGGLTDLGPARAAEFDRDGMFAEVAGLPRQLREGYAAARNRLAGAFFGTFPGIPPAEPSGVAVCGMGGSAIGADLVLACLPGLSVPATVVRGYALPEWVGPETLVVVVSYSGETEEALSCAAQARSRGCVPVCVSSGGSLAAFAEAEGLPLVVVPGGSQPRAAVGFLSMPLLATLEASGLCHEHASEVDSAATQLEADNAILGPGAPDEDNPAKTLARRLEKRLAVVYGAGPTGPVARRWKGQINENAKAPAFFNELPELDHNELMGWTSLPHVTSSTVALFLHDESERGAPDPPRGAHVARVRGAGRRHRTGGRARLLPSRAALLARAVGRLHELLPRPAVRRRPDAGRRDPGVQGQPRRRRRLTPMAGGAVTLVLTADDAASRAAGAALFPGAALESLSRRDLRPPVPFEGPLFALLGARAVRETVGLVVPAVWTDEARESPASSGVVPVADHVGLEGRGPLTGRWPAGVPRDFPSMTAYINRPTFVRAAGLGYTRPASWRRASPTSGASRASRRGRSGRGAAASSPTPWSPRPSSPRTTA